MNSPCMILGKGLFIVIEGIDGSGKTTIANMIVEKLEEMGYCVLYTFEPTNSEVISVLKTKYSDIRDPYIDALVFALDRLIHVKTEIKPFIEKGYIVISDRYYYSSVAYQSASGAPIEWVMELNKWALRPDLAIYLDVDPETALSRKTGIRSRFGEFEELNLLSRVRSIYLELVKRGLLVLIDASRNLVDVYRDVERVILDTLRRGIIVS